MRLTKQNLEELRDLVEERNENAARMKRREESISRPPVLDGMSGRSNKVGDPAGNAGSDLADLQALIQEQDAKIDAMVYAIEKDYLPKLDSFDRRILRYYYFDGYSDLKISIMIPCCAETVGRHRRSAVANLTWGGDD